MNCKICLKSVGLHENTSCPSSLVASFSRLPSIYRNTSTLIVLPIRKIWQFSPINPIQKRHPSAAVCKLELMGTCSTVRDDERVLFNPFAQIDHGSKHIFLGLYMLVSWLTHKIVRPLQKSHSWIARSMMALKNKIDPPQHPFWVQNGQIETPT